MNFTRKAIRAAIAQTTDTGVACKAKSALAILVPAADYSDIIDAVDAARWGLGAVSTEKLVKLAGARL